MDDHADCARCDRCGLPNCPDCDPQGRTCIGVHPGDRIIQLDLAGARRYRQERVWSMAPHEYRAWMERNGTWVTA